LFTEPFGLDRTAFAGKRILDVGCGPRGSLEWAGDALERVGVDPLADRYRTLGIDRHAMSYVKARAESLPFPDAHFDLASALNALDHVDDPARAAGEITRVTRPGRLILLIVEVNHAPTVTEPLTLGWDAADLFAPGCERTLERRLEKTRDGIHDSVLNEPVAYDPGNASVRPGILVACLARR
jgi:SAM-dependent methyltransferase